MGADSGHVGLREKAKALTQSSQRRRVRREKRSRVRAVGREVEA